MGKRNRPRRDHIRAARRRAQARARSGSPRGGDRHAGALNADVGPGIAHVEGAADDRRIGVDLLGLGAQPVDRLAAVLGRGDQGQLDEGGGELRPPLEPLHQVLRRPAPGLELIDVGVGPVAHEDVAGGGHRLGDVGVVVQGRGQRRPGPPGPDPLQQVPLGVLDPLHGHRSVQAQEDAVQGSGFGQPPEELAADLQVGGPLHQGGGHGPGRQDGNDLGAMPLQRLQGAADLRSGAGVGLDDVGAAEELGPPEVVQRREPRREGVGLVHQGADGDPHQPPVRRSRARSIIRSMVYRGAYPSRRPAFSLLMR